MENEFGEKGTKMEKITLSNSNMRMIYDTKRGGFVSVKSSLDAEVTDFVLTPEEFPQYDVENAKWLGTVNGVVTVNGKEQLLEQMFSKESRSYQVAENKVCVVSKANRYAANTDGLYLTQTFEMKSTLLEWTICLENKGIKDIEIREMNLPLLMNQYFRNDNDFKYEHCVLRHTCITGNSSYLYWEKSSGNEPILLMLPLGDTAFFNLEKEQKEELFQSKFGDGYGYEGLVRTYLVTQKPVIDCASNSFALAAGKKREFRIGLTFLKNVEEILTVLDEQGQIALRAVPGIVGPIDTEFEILTRPVGAKVSLADPADEVLRTQIKNGWCVSSIHFGGYGRRKVVVSYGEKKAYYCFFVTEPVKAMIDEHAAFVAENHFETDKTDPCYHALLMWDMTNKRRINNTFNPYFEDWWTGGSDDPGLASGLFLAEKNVYRPQEKELHVLNSFIEDFIIGRLTEQPGWRVHRMVPWYVMFEPWAGRGADDIWRAFNYVHVINIMRDMYLIQKRNQLSYLREAAQYLKMAYEYTKAMFHYWMFPDGVGASEYGNMGEMTLPLCLAKDLEAEGFIQEAAEMNAIFDKKAHFFASENFPFGSEMVYDSTAFEAVYSYGKRIQSEHVMAAAANASFANRGKQPVWYLYNTDVRGGGDTEWNTSYMTQLGAYPLLDYTLDEGHVKEDWILSYYGAFLSGWLIYNSGGYWNAEPENRGATGWITMGKWIDETDARVFTETDKKKMGMPYVNGCVSLSGEAGIGFFGALRTACAIVLDHSVLGRIGLGCTISNKGNETDEENGDDKRNGNNKNNENNEEIIVPHDGLSMRVYHVPQRLKIEIDAGEIKEIRISTKSIIIQANVWGCDGAVLSFLSIPEEGKKQQLLYKKKVEKGEKIYVKVEKTCLGRKK